MTLSRRRFLSISAAALMAPGAASAESVQRWRGRALGAEASMVFSGVDQRSSRALFQQVERELVRLEAILSLYLPHSQLSRLNRTGQLANPAPELLSLLSLCDVLHKSTGGLFDPSLQPVWLALAQSGDQPDPEELNRARDLVGWDKVQFEQTHVSLSQPGMALTLNGVAQGAITDRIASLLKDRGLTDVLIDMGEVMALGTRSDGAKWHAGIAAPDGQIVDHIRLKDRALATSAPEGTILNATTRTGHILNPRNDTSAPRNRLVSISSPSAAIADGLSTAGCLMDEPSITMAVSRFTGARLETLL